MTVNVKKESKNKYKKLQYCKFCMKGIAKLSRHLITLHGDEDDVKRMKMYDIKDSRYKATLTKLRNDGAFMHNRSVIARGVGELHTKRRPVSSSGASNKTSSSYLPCPNCRVMLKASYLYRHKRNCDTSRSDHSTSRSLRSEAFMLLPAQYNVQDNFSNDVLKHMDYDECFRIIRKDSLILQFGQKMYQRLSSKQKQKNYIGTKMRELARFFSVMREITKNPIKTLTTCFRCRELTNVMAACRQIGKYNATTMRYEIPSLVLKIGYSLKNSCDILIGDAIERENEIE